MRHCLAIAALLLALPSAAQAPFADSAGVYVALDGVSFGSAESSRLIDATVGYRFNASADAGLRVRHEPYQWAVGPTAGYTVPLGRDVRARVSGAALYQTLDTPVWYPTPGSVSSRSLTADAAATVGTTLPLVGTLRLDPAVGAYVEATRRLSYERISDDLPPGFTYGTPSGHSVSVGAQIELPLSFRLLGETATVVPTLRVPIPGTVAPRSWTGQSWTALSLRLNF